VLRVIEDLWLSKELLIGPARGAQAANTVDGEQPANPGEGNAAFMRNWPYAYSLSNAADSPVKGKFDVAPLPAQPANRHVGTIGGWGQAVSR